MYNSHIQQRPPRKIDLDLFAIKMTDFVAVNDITYDTRCTIVIWQIILCMTLDVKDEMMLPEPAENQ